MQIAYLFRAIVRIKKNNVTRKKVSGHFLPCDVFYSIVNLSSNDSDGDFTAKSIKYTVFSVQS